MLVILNGKGVLTVFFFLQVWSNLLSLEWKVKACDEIWREHVSQMLKQRLEEASITLLSSWKLPQLQLGNESQQELNSRSIYLSLDSTFSRVDYF